MTSAPTSWTDHLAYTKGGIPRAIFRNAVTALREHPGMFNVLGFDEFAYRTMLMNLPPWEMPSNLLWEARPWTPQDDLACCDWLQHQKVNVSAAVTADAVELVAHDCIYHPVKNYLRDCQWDGTMRLDTMMAVYFGAELSPYSKAIGRMLMVSAIARIFDPGCKVDTLTVLEGKQGLLKSTAIKVLFEPWFTDEIADLGSKDAAMQCGGVWCIEIAELDAMSKADVSKVKAFLSRTADRYRPPYGRRVIERPRSCIFFGSTNNRDYLKDATGARRFHPLAVGMESNIDVGGLGRDRDLLWGEAVEAYNRGDIWWFSDPTTEAAVEAAAQQEERYQLDPWEQPIADYLNSRLHQPPDLPACRVDLQTVFRQAINLDQMSAWDQTAMNRVAKIMQRLGWVRKQFYVEVVVQGKAETRRRWLYRRDPTKEELEMDARQAEVLAAEQDGKANNVTSMKCRAPDADSMPVMKEVTAPQA
jgi:predicted P-loop ATPase